MKILDRGLKSGGRPCGRPLLYRTIKKGTRRRPHGLAARSKHMTDATYTPRTGDISVETAHIFPIIKKWLYSEKDIFLRELISNAADAVTKHRRLISLGETEDDETAYRITVTADKTAGTLTVSDNGIGMTEEELVRYLGSIALSGALDFINKYEGSEKEGEGGTGIIGHFGLGFYSAFMVANTVEVITKSYLDAPAVRWVCRADGGYELFPAEREGHGTDIVLHVSDEETAYLSAGKLRDMLDRYCSFMPTEIYFEEADGEDDTPEDEPAEITPPTPINDVTPLWQKKPSECTDEDYKAFYRKVFGDHRDPLFHIHINADYPLNFKGILFFPRWGREGEPIDGQIKLYYNQVFVADNIKEVMPEYLFMLKGILDCPELPLNVSRSYLQNNTYVKKVAAHIVKKVTDKLNSLIDTEREAYEGLWDSLKPFVEYACMRDRKFYDRAKDAILLKLTDGRYVTVAQYFETEAADATEDTTDTPSVKTVYYTSDPEGQAQYVSLFEAEGMRVAVMDQYIDTQFVQMYETYEAASGIKFVRIDADVAEALCHKDAAAAEDEALVALYRRVSDNAELEIKFAALKDGSVPAMLTVSEESRRMEEMMRMYALQSGMSTPTAFPVAYTLTVNTSSPLTARLTALATTEPDRAEMMAAQIFRLCLLSQRKLTAEELRTFLTGSYDLLGQL